MKRILIAILAIAAVNTIAAYHTQYDNEVRTCKRQCRRHDRACYNECERSVPGNFAYGVVDLPAAAVQTGTLGIIPTNRQAVEDYNPPYNFGRGIKRIFVDTGRVATLGFAARGNEHETGDSE